MTRLRFPAKLKVMRHSYFGSVDHEQIGSRWNRNRVRVASAVVAVEPLHASHFDDPNYIHQENIILISEVEEEARSKLVNRYYTEQEMEEIFRRYSYPTRQYNFREDDEGSSFKSRLEDAVFRSQELSLIPDVARDLLEEAAYQYDDATGEERRMRGKALKKALEERGKEIFLPRVRTEYRRVYSMPEPFDRWDDRNIFQQWYFVFDGKSVWWIQGGSASSGQREIHGRFSHACAFYEHLNGKVPTWIFKYSRHNQMILEKRFPSFRTMSPDLTGNYPADWEKTKILFKGKTLSFDYEKRKIRPVSAKS